MDFNTIWFILIAVLFIGYFILEGFDFGVGILLPFLGKDDRSRRVIINTIGPHWDGNEVWLLTAGGAMFAAFPNWYATLFSGFYLPLFLLLLALIFRGVAFEFRYKATGRSRQIWDYAFHFGSLIAAFMQGMFLPKDWGEKVWLYDTLSYGRGLYMPWWGQIAGGLGVQTILETSDDAGVDYQHPVGGPTRIQPASAP